MACANAVFVRIAEPWSSDYVRYRSARVTPIVLRFAIDFDQRREIDPVAQNRRNGGPVWREAVCGQLKPSSRCMVKIVGEIGRVGRGPFADVPSQDHLRMPFKSRETPHVAKAFLSLETQTGFFFHPDEAPNLVTLNVVHLDILDFLFHERSALFACLNHVADDRIAVNAKRAFQGADGITFQEQAENGKHLLGIDAPMIHWPRFLVRECPLAGIAPIALRTVTIPTEAPHFVFAEMALHDRTNLSFVWRFG
jgi:hypothetical protein